MLIDFFIIYITYIMSMYILYKYSILEKYQFISIKRKYKQLDMQIISQRNLRIKVSVKKVIKTHIFFAIVI